MKLIINIPAYNEAQAIGTTIKNLPRSLKGISDVLVQVIDDGSRDNTAEIARSAGADIVISHSTNRRLGAVFNTAVESALANGADIMINIDADGQFDTNEIPKLLTPILNGRADMVIGERFSAGNAHNIPIAKKVLNRIGAKIVGHFLNVDIHDLTCGFRAHNRETLLRLNPIVGFTYTQESIIDAIGKKLSLQWVPITVHYFPDRKSRVVRSIWHFVNNSARIIVKAVRDIRPMKFFGFPGLFLITISVAVFCYFLFLYFPHLQITPYRNYLLSAIVLFLIGLQFIVFALIADMIKASRKLTEDIMYEMRKERYSKK